MHTRKGIPWRCRRRSQRRCKVALNTRRGPAKITDPVDGDRDGHSPRSRRREANDLRVRVRRWRLLLYIIAKLTAHKAPAQRDVGDREARSQTRKSRSTHRDRRAALRRALAWRHSNEVGRMIIDEADGVAAERVSSAVVEGNCHRCAHRFEHWRHSAKELRRVEQRAGMHRQAGAGDVNATGELALAIIRKSATGDGDNRFLAGDTARWQ